MGKSRTDLIDSEQGCSLALVREGLALVREGPDPHASATRNFGCAEVLVLTRSSTIEVRQAAGSASFKMRSVRYSPIGISECLVGLPMTENQHVQKTLITKKPTGLILASISPTVATIGN